MSLLSTKLKAPGRKGKAMIGPVCVERTMNCRMKNMGQENLLRERTHEFDRILDRERINTSREQTQLRQSMTKIGKVSMSTDDWLEKNRRRQENWKNREREKIANKHSRVWRAYRCPAELKLDTCANVPDKPEVKKDECATEADLNMKTRRCKTAPIRRHYIWSNTTVVYDDDDIKTLDEDNDDLVNNKDDDNECKLNDKTDDIKNKIEDKQSDEEDDVNRNDKICDEDDVFV